MTPVRPHDPFVAVDGSACPGSSDCCPQSIGITGRLQSEQLSAFVGIRIEGKLYHEKYGLPNFWVLFCFRSAVRMRRAIKTLESFHSPAARFILFHLVNEEAPPGYLFTTPCERVGHDPLQLNQAT